MKPTLASALSCLVVCLTFSASSSYAQPGPAAPNGEPPGRVGLDQDPGNDNIGYAVAVPFGPWISIDGTFGDGIGWEDGFVTASAFVPRHINPGTDLMFAMVNLSVAENGHGAINLGSGYRYRAASLNRIFGFSGWLDMDDGHENEYYRVGVSLESLGKYLDYRLNTYLVLGNDSYKVRDSIIGPGGFRGNFFLFPHQTVFENAYSGADFEVGGQVPFLGRYGVSAYAGPYYVRHDEDKDAVGFKLRLETQINEDLTLGAQFSNDDVFSNATYFNLAWTYPDGRGSRWFRQRPMKERMGIPVARERRVAVHRKLIADTRPLIDPNDGQAMFFQFVSDDAAATGNGTFENPTTYANLVNTARTDIIFVTQNFNAIPQTRNGTLALFDNQRLLGAGIVQRFPGPGGPLVFPGSGTGITPILANNNAGPVIQLANNNEVSGFRIDGTNGANPPNRGIVSRPGGIGSFRIINNQFTNNADGVALFVSQSGYGVFQNNTLTGAGATSNRGFSVMTGGGAGTVLNLLVADNTATGYTGLYEDLNNNNVLDPGEDTINVANPNLAGGNGNAVLDRGVAFEVTANAGSTINANAPAAAQPTGILRNIETASGTGLLLNGVAAGDLNAVILNNQFNNNITQNTGMRFVANGGTVDLPNVDSNTVDGNNGNGIAMLSRGGGALTGSFTNNLIRNNALSQFLIDADTGAVTINAFTDNDLSRTTAGASGMLINSNNAVIVVNNVLRNDFIATAGAANRSFGIGGTVNNGNLTLFVGDGTQGNQNFLTGNGTAGIGLNLTGNNVSDIRILRNTITGTVVGVPAVAGFAGEGIRLNFTNTATYNNPTPIDLTVNPDPDLTGIVRTIDSNTITGNAGFGVSVQSLLSSAIDSMIVTRNTITGNTGGGVSFVRQQTANITNVAVTDNLVNTNTGDGGFFRADNLNVEDTYLIARNTFIGNTGRGLGFDIRADADIRARVFNNTITGNTSHGIGNTEVVNALTDSRTFILLAFGNDISGNTGNGVNLNGAYDVVIGNDGLDANGNSLANTIRNNSLAGIISTAVGNGIARNNLISGNGALLAANNGAGIDINTTIAIGNTWTIDHNMIFNNRGDGVELLASTAVGAVNADLNATITRNLISSNDARGIDVLARGDSEIDLIIGGPTGPVGGPFGPLGDTINGDGNFVTGNGQEGVYVVLTSSTAQNQTNLATVALDATGSLDARARIELDMQNNSVDGNGNTSAFNTTGLVIRVGTTDSDGVGTIDPLTGNLVTGARTFANNAAASGVQANVLSNRFAGNLGNDVFFGSFVSTVAPPDNRFDPMARLDMTFRNNEVESLNAIGEGAGYTNASTVKSSLAVFTSTSRNRNATLLPANLVNVADNMTVVNNTPDANAVAPTGTRFQSTTADNGPQNPVPAGLYNSVATNASEFRVDFDPGNGPPGTRTITAYATPTIGAPTNAVRSDFTVAPTFGAVVAGDTFEVDYMRVSGIGGNGDYTAGPPAILGGTAANIGTFRVNSNVLGTNLLTGATARDFDGQIINLNALQNDPLFNRPFIWTFTDPLP